MFSTSVTAMTIVDLIALAASSIAVAQIYKNRSKAMDTGVLLTLTGLLIWAFFFLADLAIMYGGDLITDRPPTAVMNELHVNFYWYGGIAGLLCVAAGVANSHRRNQSASSPREIFIELIDHLPDPCMLVEQDKIVAVSQALDGMIYQDKEALLDKDPYEVWDFLEFNIPPREEMMANLASHGSWSFVTKLIRPDGTTGHAEVRTSLLDAENGRILIVLGDITARIEAEQRLQESEIRLATAQDIADLGYWHYHVDDRTTLWSPTLLRIFGIDTQELQDAYSTDQSRWALVHPDDVDLVRNHISHAINTALEPPELSVRVNRPDGEVRHVRIRMSVRRDSDKIARELFAVAQDVTESVRTEERLRHAQKMETVGSLTGGVAHDFNNLLQVILGNTELLDGTSAADEEAAESIRAVKHAAERGAELTRLLLAFSRRQVLEPKVVNINDYIEQLLPLLRRSLGESIAVEPQFADDLEYCRIDPGQLENCILNMAINAQHAMPEGGTLTIETRNTLLSEDYAMAHDEVAAGRYVQLTISDTGSGMPDEIRERAFEPFFTTKEVGKGSGLGLSMVYGFIKQSEGHVEIASKPGVGTAITLYLPIVERMDEVQQDTDSPLDEQRFSGRVLLVEDNVQVAAITRRFLESLGFEVVLANDIDQTRTVLAQEHHFALLLTDVVLPGGANGPAIAEEVKRSQPDIKVLYMSGYTENAIEQDNDGILLDKPFSKAELVQKLNQVL